MWNSKHEKVQKTERNISRERFDHIVIFWERWASWWWYRELGIGHNIKQTFEKGNWKTNNGKHNTQEKFRKRKEDSRTKSKRAWRDISIKHRRYNIREIRTRNIQIIYFRFVVIGQLRKAEKC